MVHRNRKRFAGTGRGRLLRPEREASRRTPEGVTPSEEAPLVGEVARQGTDRFAARDFTRLIGMEGFSETLLRNHFTLYQGYVENANKLLAEFEEMARQGAQEGPRYAELKRRFGWEYNGIRLHELYFENLTRTPKPLDPDTRLAERFKEDFGTFETWKKDFEATGAIRGIGWVVLYHDPLRNRLFNAWIHEHDAGHFAGATPILIMDVFEHAYMTDYGTKKPGYIEAFFKCLSWDAAAARLP